MGQFHKLRHDKSRQSVIGKSSEADKSENNMFLSVGDKIKKTDSWIEDDSMITDCEWRFDGTSTYQYRIESACSQMTWLA